MSLERNKAQVARLFSEVLNKGNLAVAEEIISPAFVRRELTTLFRDVTGPEGAQGMAELLRGAFPDIEATVEDMVAEDDRVAARVTLRGTHRGDFLGIAPTGRAIAVTAINIYRFSEGKLVETWQLEDALGLMRQLGALPD